MMTMKGSALSDKKDLHVGGMGARALGALTTAEPRMDQPADAVARILRRASKTIQNADSMVRVNPWVAVGLGACVGVAAGYLFSRRF